MSNIRQTSGYTYDNEYFRYPTRADYLAACDACEGKGWIIAAIDGDNQRLEIERCDQCERYESDEQAAKLPEAQSELSLARQLYQQGGIA